MRQEKGASIELTKEFISKASLLKNLPLPLFASAPADSPRRKRGV